MIKRPYRVLVLLLVLCVSSGLGQSERQEEGIVARAGESSISEREFLERFELLPGLQRHRADRLEEAKLEVLYSLIAEKLLAQEAKERKLDQDSTFRLSFDEVRKMLSRDELYRQEVSGKVRVTPQEIAAGMAQAQKEILMSFIYCDKREDAEFLRKQLASARDFNRLTIDPSLHAVRDTATIIWGDATPEIEKAAYNLSPGQISPVIRSGTGYYIMKVERSRRSAFFSSLQPSVLHERIEDRIRQRKEEVRLNDYVSETLKHKIGYTRPAALKVLTDALKKVYAAIPVSGKTGMSETMVREIRKLCGQQLKDTLSVAGSTVWTIGEVIEKFYTKGFALDSISVRAIPSHVNGVLRVWVQQELLAQEALERGLDRFPAVRRQLEQWHDNFLEQSMRLVLRREAKVSDAEVLSFMQSGDSAFVIPKVQIRELRTSSLDDMQQALNEIQSGKPLSEVISRWCSDKMLRQRKGISDAFPVSERYPVGEIAGQMLVGQQYGPVKEGAEYVYFELMSKDTRAEPSDTVYASKKARARSELLRQKEKRLTNLFLAQSGQQRGFTIFQDRLSKIKVSPIPMMTFRVLGFGGRMFAVPFLDRQIDWLNVEPPTQKIAF
ncbi:MAG TPA: peptidyl-prolyl cis-trans isomerase [Bacteroidota bacterium]|nr:peptidyl-prolyl cis-trans isomerase [Bacteroidota bacterium]